MLGKLGREDDAYHATCLVMIDYDDADAVLADSGEEAGRPLVEAGIEPDPDVYEESAVVSVGEVLSAPAQLPRVAIRHEAVPPALAPARFLATMVNRVLDTTPVNFHREARARRQVPA